jgi:hypothetical protein
MLRRRSSAAFQERGRRDIRASRERDTASRPEHIFYHTARVGLLCVSALPDPRRGSALQISSVISSVDCATGGHTHGSAFQALACATPTLLPSHHHHHIVRCSSCCLPWRYVYVFVHRHIFGNLISSSSGWPNSLPHNHSV